MAPPPPVMISGTAISGAPITVPPPPPTVIDIPVLPPKKPLLFPFKKKGPFSLVRHPSMAKAVQKFCEPRAGHKAWYP